MKRHSLILMAIIILAVASLIITNNQEASMLQDLVEVQPKTKHFPDLSKCRAVKTTRTGDQVVCEWLPPTLAKETIASEMAVKSRKKNPPEEDKKTAWMQCQ